VDNSQGEEAAVIIVSTLKGFEALRGAEFRFNPHRFNAAAAGSNVSRSSSRREIFSFGLPSSFAGLR
jgi:hypothetical protein